MLLQWVLLQQFRSDPMELLSSMLSIVKNVSDTDREFKLLREKLVYNIKKSEAALTKYYKERHVQAWVAEHLERRLEDARDKQLSLDKLLSSSADERISLKDKFKLSLPFNNERDKISQIIDDLKNACEEVMNGNIPRDPSSAKRRPSLQEEPSEKPEKLALPQKEELQVDSQIDEMYEMGPTIQENNAMDFAQEYTRTHTIELKVEAIGLEAILKVLEPTNRSTVVEHSCERLSKEPSIELFKLGRLNFKNEYKVLKQLYPDIDKVSKNAHFTIRWARPVPHLAQADRSQLSDASNKKSHLEVSQKKEEAEQFFSVADVEHGSLENGQVVLEKEKRSLYRKLGEKWVKVEEEMIQVANGEEVAVCLGKEQRPDLAFKISYQWK